jgi:hypothetical protein
MAEETNIQYNDVVPGAEINIELKIELGVRFKRYHKVPKKFEGKVVDVEEQTKL